MLPTFDDDEIKSIKFLDKNFQKAIQERNVDHAEKAIKYLQEILIKHKQETRLMKYKLISNIITNTSQKNLYLNRNCKL